jgi:predicted ATPase
MNGLRAEVLATAGRQAEALEEFGKALVLAGEIDETAYDAWLHRARGELLLQLRGAREAIEAFYEGLALARRQEAKGFELMLALPFARLLAEQGRRGEARDVLAPVCGWFTEGFDAADLNDAKALLDELR